MWSEEEILDVLVPCTAGQVKKTVGEVFSQDTKAPGEAGGGSVQGPRGAVLRVTWPGVVGRLVELPKIVVGLAVSSNVAGSSCPGERYDRRSRYTRRSVKHRLLGSHSAVPRQIPNSKRVLVKLCPLGPVATQLALTARQLQRFLVKLGLPSLRRTVPLRNPVSWCPLVKLDLLGPK